jgi:hypothetical protein
MKHPLSIHPRPMSEPSSGPSSTTTVRVRIDSLALGGMTYSRRDLRRLRGALESEIRELIAPSLPYRLRVGGAPTRDARPSSEIAMASDASEVGRRIARALRGEFDR